MEYSDHDKCPRLPWMIEFNSTDDGHILNGQLKAAFANTTLEYLSCLSVKSKTSNFRQTQLMCTFPPYITCKTIEDLLHLGLSVAVIRMPTFDEDKAMEMISKIRGITDNYSKKIGRLYSVAICLEIRGPEIKTGHLKDPNKKEILLEKGKITNLTTDPSYEEFVTEDLIFVDYQKINEIIQPGDKVILNKGSVTLSAIEVAESIIRCIIEKAGKIMSNVSVSLPGALIDLPEISSNDKAMLHFGVEQSVDMFLISGVINRESVTQIKSEMGEAGLKTLVISKIDNALAVENIDEIIRVSDAICIHCERLMVEIAKEKVFLIQKSILAKCNLVGKPAITNVKILDMKSLSKSEVSDIANAIIDGIDAILLQQEACGAEALKSVSMICKEAEPAVYQKQVFSELVNNYVTPIEVIYSLAISSVEASLKCNAAAIITLTSSGRTAKLLSRFRPRCPIIVITRYARVARQLRLFKYIDPIVYLKPFDGNWKEDVDYRVQLGITYGKYVGYIRMGDAVVIVTGSRANIGLNNCIKIVYASDFDALPKRICYDNGKDSVKKKK